MSSPSDVSMEEILLKEYGRCRIEHGRLMAYAQRGLHASKYRELLEEKADVEKPRSLIKGAKQGKSAKQGMSSRREKSSMESLDQKWALVYSISAEESESLQEKNSQHQTSETADVSHIADKLAKLVTSRFQESPSDVSFKMLCHAQCEEQDDSNVSDGSEGEECDEEKIAQEIASLLRLERDRLEEKIKKDRVLYQHFKDRMSYTFFEKITDLFLEYVSADSTIKPEDQAQCMKIALTMEVATRLTAVDSHPTNLILGFGLKYLREHFQPWIQDQGGWEKALTSLNQEEVE